MKTLIPLTAAAALLALGACTDEPPTEDNETAAAFPGSDSIQDRSDQAGAGSPTGTAGAPAPNPPPTLPPEDEPGSPASGVTSPPER